jgi:O-antigen ligase
VTKTANDKWPLFLYYAEIAGFAITIAALPLSNFLMSVGTFWLCGAWLLQVLTDIFSKRSLQERFSRFRKNRAAQLLMGVYFLVLLGLFFTSSMDHAQWDLRMKLPLLILPIVITTLDPLSEYWRRVLKGIFLLSLTFAVLWCLIIYWGLHGESYRDVRNISVFISHVRFSLLIVLGICIAFHETWNKPAGPVFSILITVFFLYFLYVLQSMTGFAALGCVIFYTLVRSILRAKKKTVRVGALSLLVTLPLVVLSYLKHSSTAYFNAPPVDWNTLETTTPHGEAYEHNAHYPLIENGHYVMNYIAWGELYSGWMSRSMVHPDSTDGKGNMLKGTLIRYLASKGLRKDLDGIAALSDEDVRAIESGIPTMQEKRKNGINRRIDNILFEYSNYKAGGSPNGHSVIQRLEFWRAATGIIREHPFTGVGTGDVKTAFAEQYEKMNSRLDTQHRLRAHNQYLTMWVTYGILGFVFFLAVVLYPLMNGGIRNPLLAVFILIAALSFLTEDTLESQAGVMFFAFFYLFFTMKGPEPAEPPQA